MATSDRSPRHPSAPSGGFHLPERIDIHVHLHGEMGGQQPILTQILAGISQLLTKVTTMAGELDTLTTEVQETRTVMGSAVRLLQGLKQKLDEAGTDPAKLQALSASLDQGQQELAAAITANTPAEEGDGSGDTSGDTSGDDGSGTGGDTSGGFTAESLRSRGR